MGCIPLRTLTFPLPQSIWNFRIMQHAMKTLSEKLFPRSCLFYVQNQKLFQSRMEAACWDSVKLLARRCNSCWRTRSWIFFESSWKLTISTNPTKPHPYPVSICFSSYLSSVCYQEVTRPEILWLYTEGMGVFLYLKCFLLNIS